MRPILSRQSRIFVSVVLLAVIFALSDWAQFIEIIEGIDTGILALMFGVAIVERVLSAYRWYALVHGKSPSINFYTMLRITFVSIFLGQAMPGSVGVELVRINGLAQLTGNLAMSFASVLVERFFALLALGIIVFVGLAASPAILPIEISEISVLALITLTIGLVMVMNAHARALTFKLIDYPALHFVSSRLHKLHLALDEYRTQPGLIVWTIVLSFVFQFTRVTLFVVGAWALGINVPTIYFLVVVPVAVIARLLPISFGGLGIRELSLVPLLGLVDVSPEAALSLSLLAYLMELLAGGLPGAILFTRRGLHKSSLRD